MNSVPYELVLQEIQSGQTDLMPSDVLAFSEPLRSAINAMVRLGRFSLTEFTEKLPFTREETKNIANALVKRKLFEVASYSTEEETYYLAHLSGSTRPLTKPPSDIWGKID
ncbi:MAG: hypothetical protein UZ14_CFX002001434 [Chloroflexi bacterium OLB14]|nr:MAG: hypothetical protein UZ14_CFX002001434 [Chloroflexi bacterium OLB14]